MKFEPNQRLIPQFPAVNNDEALARIFNIDDIIKELPENIQKPVLLFSSPEERLVAVYTMLVVSGTFFPNAWLNYKNKVNYLPLMLFVIGPPSSGKGALSTLKNVLNGINDHLCAEYNNLNKKYKEDCRVYKEAISNGNIMEEPVRPKLKMVVMPGNTGSSKLIEQLSDNSKDVIGIIIEPEIDAFGLSTKSKHGDMNSTIMRVVFHHEQLSLRRKTNDEYITVQTPKLAFALSGTLNQIKNLVPSNEDGTFSRFLILNLKGSLAWSDVQPTEDYKTIDEQIDIVSKEYLQIFKKWRGCNIEIRFTDQHWILANKFGKTHLNDSFYFGEHASSLVKRHTLMMMRMAATLTMMRNSDNEPNNLVFNCNDTDFNTAFTLTQFSLEHSIELFQKLPGEKPVKNINERIFLQSLPDQFNFSTALKYAETLAFPPARRTVERWLANLVKNGELIRTQTDYYIKKHVAEVAVAVERPQLALVKPATVLSSTAATATTATPKFSLS